MSMGRETTVLSHEGNKRQERAALILDVAEDLLLRHGYKRITIDDIAQQAGIGKGTIYLHWKTKESLFGTLVLREVISIWKELLLRLRADPEQVLFSRVMRTMMLVGMTRPLAKALFTADRELLGKLAESGMGRSRQTQQAILREDLLTLLRELNLLRSDMDMAEMAHAIRATVTGFMVLEPSCKEGDPLTLEMRANALAQTVHAAFEPAELPSPAALEQVAARMNTWLETLISAFEAEMLAQIAS